MKKGKQLAQIVDRRSFLKGMGTLLVGLPLFDFMLENNGEALAATGGAIPQRLIIMYNGISIGFGDINKPELVSPTITGVGYELTEGLKALGDAEFVGLKNYTSVVSNLYIPWKPWSETTSEDPGPGGLCAMFHRGASHAQLTGSRSWEIAYKKWQDPLKPTSDFVFLNSLNQGFKPFCYSVEAQSYAFGEYVPNGDFRKITERFYGYDLQVDLNGNIVYPYNIPQNAYNDLMNLTAATQASQVNANNNIKLEVARNKSVLDFLDKRRIQYLKNELSVGDQKKLSDHFDLIRTMEKDLTQVPTTLTCDIPGKQLVYPAVDVTSHYSGEDDRSKIWSDMVLLAFKCDSTRAGTLLVTGSQSTMSVKALTGQDYFYHDTSHGPVNGTLGLINFTKMYNWHLKVMLRVAQKLMATPEGTGNMLDHSAIVLASEGGSGLTSDAGGGRQAHSTENMVSLICGKAGGLKGGVHIRTNRVHPTKVINSAMKAAGGPDTLGQVSGIIPELFT